MSSWNSLMGMMPKGAVLLGTVLSVLIPWTVYRINRALHRIGDPPWKR